MNRQELINMPKVELHCHLDGSLPKSYFERRLGRQVEEKELQVSPNCTSLAEYLEKFDLPVRCLNSIEALYEAGRDFILDLHKENVVYVEVRFAPLQHINDNLSTKEIIEAVLDGLEEGKRLTGMEYGLIICCMRHHDEKDNEKLLEDTLPYLGKGVCSVDLAGGEVPFPMSMYLSLFTKAREMGLPMTIHAGECGNAKNIEDSVAIGARRIGHGIAMTGNQAIKNLCKENDVALEVCPTSNIQTKAVDSIENYPLREFIDDGLIVTINTDNRTVSGTSLWKEYEWIQSQYEIDDHQLKKMIRDAMLHSFASEETKNKILGILQP